MKILVIGGMHGNEPLGVKLVERLQKAELKNIDSIYANSPAIDHFLVMYSRMIMSQNVPLSYCSNARSMTWCSTFTIRTFLAMIVVLSVKVVKMIYLTCRPTLV